MNIKQTLLTFASALGALAIVTTATFAIGTLTPSETVGEETHYTLNDIYNKIANFDTYTAPGPDGLIDTPGTVEATFKTLSEIYTLLEAEDADLIPENIRDGVTVFGVEGTFTRELEWSAQAPTILSWGAADTYCISLEEDGVSVNDEHQNIWRLPTYSELANAYEISQPGFQFTEPYWSSTLSDGFYLRVFMINGFANYDDVFEPPVFARCVR